MGLALLLRLQVGGIALALAGRRSDRIPLASRSLVLRASSMLHRSPGLRESSHVAPTRPGRRSERGEPARLRAFETGARSSALASVAGALAAPSSRGDRSCDQARGRRRDSLPPGADRPVRAALRDPQVPYARGRARSPAGATTSSRASDPRITRVGAFLRRWSLDELPQVWNILHGEMSIVGPRPTLRYQVEQYDEFQRRRLEVLARSDRLGPGVGQERAATGRSESSSTSGTWSTAAFGSTFPSSPRRSSCSYVRPPSTTTPRETGASARRASPASAGRVLRPPGLRRGHPPRRPRPPRREHRLRWRSSG